MKKNKVDEFDNIKQESAPEELVLIDERRFSQKLDELVLESEEMRIKRMTQHRTRNFIALNFSILISVIGAAAFGWFFLMKLDLQSAATCVIITIILAIIIHFWSAVPLKKYVAEHKTVFMPKLARALGGFKYFSERGLNPKILERSAVLPSHRRYISEDCFMGTYKGVKVIFSEARLYASAKRGEPIFHGIFVLLEAANDVIEGHTILTANTKLIHTHANTRWKSMKRVYISPSNPAWDIFQIFSTKPESAELIVGDRLLKELAEAAAVFDNAPLTAVLFGKKYVFIMIPNEKDMFEASDLYVPVATHQHALNCRREVSQILEIIDIFDLFKPIAS